jgi:HKD family nuclease
MDCELRRPLKIRTGGKKLRLIEGSELLERFQDNLIDVNNVDIAVAWLGPSLALDMLRRAANNGAKIRICVGLSGNGTDPIALKSL